MPTPLSVYHEWWWRHVHLNNLSKVVTWKEWPKLNHDRESNALTITSPVCIAEQSTISLIAGWSLRGNSAVCDWLLRSVGGFSPVGDCRVTVGCWERGTGCAGVPTQQPRMHRFHWWLQLPAATRHPCTYTCSVWGWLGSDVVIVLDAGAEGPGFKLQHSS